MNFKNELAACLSKYIDGESESDILMSFEIPPDSEMGDFAFPCFRLAKTMKKSPQVIAKEVCDKIEKPIFVSDIKTAGAYINFYLDKAIFAKEAIVNILDEKMHFGKKDIGANQVVTIDYSSPNIAKHFHVGHLRTTVIGNALYNIYNFLGYNAIGINYLGDWGTQFGKLIVGYTKWGDKEAFEKNGLDELVRVYVKFHEEADTDSSLDDQARESMLKLQNGDEEATGLWKLFTDVSLKEYNRIYERMNIKFDRYISESFYNDKMDTAVEELKEKGLLVESQGAMIVDLEKYNMSPCLILRGDGGTLYHTRDIASALHRKKEFNFAKSIYVTGLEQNLHFAQLIKVIELMGYDYYKDMIHVSYGLYNFETGKLSTRRGNVIKIEDLLNEAVNKTREIIEAKNPDLKNKEEIAEQVGIGAIKFNDMYNSRIKDVTFSWERMLNLEGETGPYVQYTHARACSLLAKGGDVCFDNVDYKELSDSVSHEVIKLLYTYPDKVVEAANKYEPYIITRHLVNVAQAFNKFYHDMPILNSEVEVKVARLALVACVKNVLASGLKLLGIEAPEQM